MNPLSLALLAGGTAMSVGGGLLGQSEAEKAAAARNAALDAHLQRMGAISAESRGLFDTALGGFARPMQDALLSRVQGGRTAAGVGNIAAPPASTDFALSKSAPRAVHSAIGRRMADAFQGAKDQAKARGELGGYSDQWTDNSFSISDASRRMSTLDNFAKGETGILNSQLDLAEAGVGKSPWPGILQGGGQLMAAAGGARRPAAGGTTMMPGQFFTNPSGFPVR